MDFGSRRKVADLPAQSHSCLLDRRQRTRRASGRASQSRCDDRAGKGAGLARRATAGRRDAISRAPAAARCCGSPARRRRSPIEWLRARQNGDGGWGQFKDAPAERCSRDRAGGVCVEHGRHLTSEDAAIQRARDFLIQNAGHRRLLDDGFPADRNEQEAERKTWSRSPTPARRGRSWHWCDHNRIGSCARRMPCGTIAPRPESACIYDPRAAVSRRC